MSAEMSHQLLQRLEAHGTEAAVVSTPALWRIYHVPMDGAEMLQKMRLLLEHRHAESTGERFLPCMNTQVSLQVPRHAKLFAAVLAPVLAQVRHIARRITTFTVCAACRSTASSSDQTVLQSSSAVFAL